MPSMNFGRAELSRFIAQQSLNWRRTNALQHLRDCHSEESGAADDEESAFSDDRKTKYLTFQPEDLNFIEESLIRNAQPFRRSRLVPFAFSQRFGNLEPLDVCGRP